MTRHAANSADGARMPKAKKIYDSLGDSLPPKEIESNENEILTPLIKEIARIEDDDIRSYVRAILLNATSFWKACSSPTPELYPPDEAFPGGLLKHTQRVYRAVEIISSQYSISSLETDMLKAAALLHDVTKSYVDEDSETFVYDFLHPFSFGVLVSSVEQDNAINADDSNSNVLTLDSQIEATILAIIRSHQGNRSLVPETIPDPTSLNMLLVIANTVAKSLHYIVDGEDIILERWITPKMIENHGDQE